MPCNKDVFNHLPVEVAGNILGLLDTRTLVACLIVSRRWRAVANSLVSRWEKVFIEEVGEAPDFHPAGCNLPNIYIYKITQYRKAVSYWKSGRVHEYKIHYQTESAVLLLHILEGGDILCATENGDVCLFCHETGNLKIKFSGHTGGVLALDVQGPFIATGSADKTIRLWNMRRASSLLTFRGHQSSVRCVSFFHGGDRIVSGSKDTTIRAWDIRTNQCILILRGHLDTVSCFSIFGAVIVSGSYDGTARLWCLNTGISLGIFSSDTSGRIYSIFFLDDKDVFITGGPGQLIHVWRVGSSAPVQTILGHCGLIQFLQPYKQMILSGSTDGTVRFTKCPGGFGLIHPPKVVSYSIMPDIGCPISCVHVNKLLMIVGTLHSSILVDPRTGAYLRTIKRDARKIWKVAYDREMCVTAYLGRTTTLLVTKLGVN